MDKSTIDKLISVLQNDSHKTRMDFKLDITLAEKPSKSDASQLLRSLLDSNGKPVADFYSRLVDLYYICNHTNEAFELITELWLGALEAQDKANQERLLSQFLQIDTHQFWIILPAVQQILLSVHLEPDFVAVYFLQLADKIKGDLAGGNFYHSVELFCKERSDDALSVLVSLKDKEPSDFGVHLVSVMLGHLRVSKSISSDNKNSLLNLENEFKASGKLSIRKSYYFSYATSLAESPASEDLVNNILDDLFAGVTGSKDDGFAFIDRLSRGYWGSESKQIEIISLLRSSLPFMKTETAFLWCLTTLQTCVVSIDKTAMASVSQKLLNLVLLIAPSLPEGEKTSNSLASLFSDILQRDPSRVGAVLDALVHAGKDVAVTVLSNDHLQYQLKSIPSDVLTSELSTMLLSDNSTARSIVFLLIQTGLKLDINFESLTSEINERQLTLLLLELKSHFELADTTSKLLFSVVPLFEKAPTQIRDEFCKHLTLQAINYPGACLDTWKSAPNSSGLLSQAIKNADQYFDRLNTCDVKLSPKTFTNFDQVTKRGVREQSRQISEGTKKNSIFSLIAHEVAIIYGESWATITNGQLGKETTPQRISHSIEVPRLEEIDPEGMMLMRMNAVQRMVNLENKTKLE